MTKNIIIYHNPRCSKSRETLALLQSRKISPTVIEYLQQPPTKTQLKNILKLLKLSPREIMRTNEPEYKSLKLDDNKLTQDQLLQAIIDCPKLLQRPIVLANGKAVIGRPPENILEIL